MSELGVELYDVYACHVITATVVSYNLSQLVYYFQIYAGIRKHKCAIWNKKNEDLTPQQLYIYTHIYKGQLIHSDI